MGRMTDHDQVLQRLRRRHDTAYSALMAAIQAALADGIGPSQIAKSSGYTREYIAKIRDRRESDAPPS